MTMRIRSVVVALAVIMLSAYLMSGAGGLEIRSKVVPAIDYSYIFSPNSGSIGSSASPSLGFHGFFYDIDDDLGNEELRINIKDGKIDGTKSPQGLIYKTSKDSKRFEFRDWGRYFTTGFMGENYFAGYNSAYVGDQEPYLYKASDHKDVLSSQILLKVLMDSDSTYVFSDKKPLRLKGGYELVLKSVDLHSGRAYLGLLKNGEEVTEKVVTCEPNADMKEQTFIYSTNINNIKNLVILAIHFERLFTGWDMQMAQVDGIFQLSEDPTQVDVGSKYGAMEISSVDSNGIEMTNRDKTIYLHKGMDSQIIGGIRLRTADQEIEEDNPLNLYIYSNITEPGTYEVRGPLDEIVQGRPYFWDFEDFPGFMYDLDSNLGTEDISIQLSGSYESGDARLHSLLYETKARPKRLKLEDWGSFSVIGFMGEKYFAGYVDDNSNLSIAHMSHKDETNLLAHEKLSKVLTDSNGQLQPRAKGSSLPLNEGYELRIKEIDSSRIVLDLAKDRRVLDSNHIVRPGNSEDSTYTYKAPIGEGEGSLIILAIHFRNAYEGEEASLATIDGIWQISDRFTPVKSGSKMGIMKIKEVNPTDGDMIIKMKSEDRTLNAAGGRTKNIMGDYCIRFADQNDQKPLRFYMIKNVTVGLVDETSYSST